MQRRITALGAAFAMSLLFAGPLSGQPPAGRAPHNLINPAKAWADGQGASLSAPSEETLAPSEETSQPETSDSSPPARPELDKAGHSGRFAYRQRNRPADREVSERSEASLSPLLRFEGGSATPGLATYYHPSLEGRRMANGRPYDPSAMTAASNRWPLGTALLISHGDSAVTLEITDRGNFRHALDLSEAAFVSLAGSTRPGVIRVDIKEAADPGEGEGE